MKRILIMRHAKSSWEFPELSDFERPLIEKGIKRTYRTCQYLKEKKIIPGLIISSPAERAKETAILVKNLLPVENEVIWNNDFYPGDPDNFMLQFNRIANQIDQVMIIGHNPTLSNFACNVLDSNETDWIPTSGCVVIDINIDGWDEPFEGKGTLLYYIKPKVLAKKNKKKH